MWWYHHNNLWYSSSSTSSSLSGSHRDTVTTTPRRPRPPTLNHNNNNYTTSVIYNEHNSTQEKLKFRQRLFCALLQYLCLILCLICILQCSNIFAAVSATPLIPATNLLPHIRKDVNTTSVINNVTTTQHIGCMYKGNIYEDASYVATDEPCLNCTCVQGTLICYLRVCPKLPDPPPVGCIILHRYQVCCPQLICTDYIRGGNKIESRAEPGVPELPYNQSAIGEGCISEGTVYAEGSAMISSSICEHCFCLAGEMKCIKPKCLLQLKDCNPIYEKNACCPVRYNCVKNKKKTSSTTESQSGGCLIDGKYFHEGEKVVGADHSSCDNCYCIRGIIHCEPLSCAPTLMGCEPVIPPGECCATSYNCSGTIEVEFTNYNPENIPDVSNNYAKLRKEQHIYYLKPMLERPKNMTDIKQDEVLELNNNVNDEYRIFASTNNPFIFIDGRNNRRIDNTNNSTKRYEDILSNQIDHLITSTEDLITAPSTQESEVTATETEIFSTTNGITTDSMINMLTSKSSIQNIEPTSDSKINGTMLIRDSNTTVSNKDEETYGNKTEIITIENCTIANETISGSNITSSVLTKTVITTNIIVDNKTLHKIENKSQEHTNDTTLKDNTNNSTEIYNTTTEGSSASNVSHESFPVSVKPNETIHDNLTISKIFEKDNSTLLDQINITKHSEQNDNLHNDTKKLMQKMSLNIIPPEIEAILNLTKMKNQDYDEYDYNEPSLPPSLPNLKIIPFVAADAVDEAPEPVTLPTSFSQLAQDKILVTENPIFRYDTQTLNLFSPPIETEGGFLPRNPPIIDPFYDNGYHTTNIIDITSATPVPAITNPPKTHEDNCFAKGKEFKHGELLSEPEACILCICFLGDIVCQQPKCPPLKPGCTRIPVKDPTICCGHIICDPETLPILDHISVTPPPKDAVATADNILTPNPFQDVIRTEPAPDLQSLIGDIIPFLQHKETSTVATPTQTTSNKIAYNFNNTVITTTTSPAPIPPIQITTAEPTLQKTDNLTETEPIKDDVDEEEFSLDKMLEILFSADKEPTKTTKKELTTTTLKTILSSENDDFDDIESRIISSNFDNGLNYIPVKFPEKSEDIKAINNSTKLDVHSATKITSTTQKPTREKIKNRNPTRPNDITSHPNNNKMDVSSPGVGILKLAGCNIYGRMYRVGRIISELSGPCLECMCTDIGVQCRPLKC